MKTAKLVFMLVGFATLAIAMADLGTGNSDHEILPGFIGDNLDQQKDLFLAAIGGGALYIAFAQL